MICIGSFKYLDEIMENKLSGIHTCYLAKVLSISGRTAKIQPLGLNKGADGTTSKQSVLTEVPISKNVRTTDFTIGCGGHGTPWHTCWHPKMEAGDIAVVLCCERDISEAKKGVNATTPVTGNHSQSNSIIIGVL